MVETPLESFRRLFGNRGGEQVQLVQALLFMCPQVNLPLLGGLSPPPLWPSTSERVEVILHIEQSSGSSRDTGNLLTLRIILMRAAEPTLIPCPRA